MVCNPALYRWHNEYSSMMGGWHCRICMYWAMQTVGAKLNHFGFNKADGLDAGMYVVCCIHLVVFSTVIYELCIEKCGGLPDVSRGWNTACITAFFSSWRKTKLVVNMPRATVLEWISGCPLRDIYLSIAGTKKSAHAWVTLKEGTGRIDINGQDILYFPRFQNRYEWCCAVQ